jgi:hypothetical protein
MWFCKGLFTTLFAIIFAYLTQLKLYDEERKKRQEIQKPEGERVAVREDHRWVLAIAILLAMFAAIAFFKGCLSAGSAMTAFR